MKVRFQADADLNHIVLLAVVRREPQVDFQSASLARLEGLADPEVLARPARDSRVLVSDDQTTMPSHFARFIVRHASPGLIIVPQHLAPAAAAEDLLLVWHATADEEWTNRVVYLPI